MTRPSDEPIISLENPQVRLARSLLEPAGRRRHGLFLVEGLRLVREAAEAAVPRLVLHTPQFGRADAEERRLLLALRRSGAAVRQVSERVLAHVTDTVTPQGIVAVMPLPGEAEGTLPPPPEGEPDLVLIMDGIGDPGNAGTLLRSATGAAATAVIATRGTVDLYAPKVVRAGAGAHFQLAVYTEQTWGDLPQRLQPDCQVLLADARASTRYWELDWTRPSAIVVSHEAHGASEGARAMAGGAVCVPTRGIESLNVAVAGSILLFEALRQRQTRGH
ncbi:MAG TPA: RNA methyltransferase [Chloroflexota bacterium]|jgi:TrmH family RNA methyltransferase|nr:RNA methyltransferase [Chloroflexota bacterium]